MYIVNWSFQMKQLCRDVIVHRLLAASLGLYKLPAIFQDRPQLTSIADNLNYRHRNAQMASRSSIELHTIIFFRKRPTDTEARIVKIRANGFIVFVPKYGIEGPVYLTMRGEKGGGEWAVDEQQQQKIRKTDGSIAYAGAFLVKDDPGSEATGSDTEKNINELKGKELLNRLHEVGTLAQITSIQGDQVVLIGHRRLRITEMVSEDPLTVQVDHLKDLPYNKDDDVIKATSIEVITTLRDVLKTSSLWRDHVQTYNQV